MPETTSFTIEGLDRLERALREFPEQTNALMRASMQGAGEIVRNEFAVYPPATGANSPPGDGYRWYERGFGTRTVTGRAYATSQALGRSWNIQVKGVGTGVKAVVGTRVTYAPFVQSRERQVWFHQMRGWQTIEDALDKKATELQEYFRRVIERALQLVARRGT